MGDALDEGEFEAYEPEPEGELEDEVSVSGWVGRIILTIMMGSV